MTPVLQPADIFLTQGPGLVSRLIRFFFRGIGERRARVNHVGVVVQEGFRETAVVVEALSRVREHKLWDQYGPEQKDLVAVYRALNLTEEERATVVAAARKDVHRKYGYGAVAAHLLDGCP